MDSIQKNAKVAGWLYLSLALLAPFAIIYVPGKLIVRGNATATAQNILGHETLFRVGILCELLVTILFIFVVLALYRLLKAVDQKHAVLMAVLALVSVPIGLVTAVYNMAALMILRGDDILSVFEKSQLDSLAMMFLRLNSQGMVVAAIFWGLWLFPFGILVIRSGFIPRVFGILLFFPGFAYLASSAIAVLLPEYSRTVSPFLMVLMMGELPIVLWLVIKGARTAPAGTSAA